MIQFNDDYRAITDPYNVILQKRKYIRDKVTKEIIKETWVNMTYHATYEQALETLVDKKIRACSTSEEIVNEIKELKKMIKGLKLPKR